MAKAVHEPTIPSRRGGPTWEVVEWFPDQGEWSEEEYLSLGEGRLIEFDGGCLEFLPTPKPEHQLIVQRLCRLLQDFALAGRLGQVFAAPLPVRLWPGKYREPDVVYVRPGRLRSLRSPPEGADLVVEVVSPGEINRRRDEIIKRREYAEAGIAEYWIVDPAARKITVLALTDGEYAVAGSFGRRSRAKSTLLEGFEVDVGELFKLPRA